MMALLAFRRFWLVLAGMLLCIGLWLWLSPLHTAAATLTVDTTNDTITGGQCSLRAAITAVNSQTPQGSCPAGSGVNDTIRFAIPGGGVQTIAVGAGGLPPLTKPVVIDGTTQPSFSGTPLIVVNGSGAGSGADGLTLNVTASGSTVKGLIVNGFSGNGIVITGNTNTVAGNYIGTNAAGTAPLRNSLGGIDIVGGATNNTIGGTAVGAGNVISGNDTGVFISGSGTSGNTVAGNYIGTNAAGTAALRNSLNGIDIVGGATNNTIGGTVAGARNLISGNDNPINGTGVFISGSGTNGNTVAGNYIGTNAAGTAALPNTAGGVDIVGGATNNTIGGTTVGARNLISGNGTGVFISDSGTSGNTVAGNYIGTNAAGTAALPNAVDGVDVVFGTTNNTIGGMAVGAGNVIAFNGQSGVLVGGSVTDTASGNSIRGNAIHDNGALGIDLAGDGVTANHATSPTAGPNHFQNYPVLTGATLTGGTVTITGTLTSTASTTFHLDFSANGAADPSGNGEGQTYLGSQDVTTGGTGTLASPFSFSFPALPGQSVITATATNATTNDTSEFAADRTVSGIALPTLAINNVSQPKGNSGTTPFVFTVTLSASSAQTVTVNDATADGTATVADNDYQATSGTLTFPPGVTSQTITVLVTGDTTVEPDETFTVTLSAPVNATIAAGTGTGTIVNAGGGGGGASGLQFYPLAKPVRLLDTRVGSTAFVTPNKALTAGQTLSLPGQFSYQGVTIPSIAQAIVGNATVANGSNGTPAGFATIFPSGVPLPLTSNLNFVPGTVRPNAFTVALGSDTRFNLYSSSGGDFVVDISGYYAPVGAGGLYFHPLAAPVRELDTRSGATAFLHPGTTLTAGQTLTLPGSFTYNSITIPASAKALVGNATVANGSNGTAAGFATLYPDDVPLPLASNLNFVPGTVAPNAFTVGVGGGGGYKLYSSSGGDFVVDITGYLDTTAEGGLLFTPLSAPVRELDTRSGATAFVHPSATLTAGQTLTLPGSFTYNSIVIPASAKALVGNATVANDGNATPAGFATLYPDDVALPLASNLNFVPGQVAPNAITVGVGADGKYALYSSSGGDFIIDITGYFS